MRRLLVLVTVVLGLSLAGCSLVSSRLSGSGPTPDEYFEGAAAELAGAIRSRDAERIARLIDDGADIEATGRHGLTMLQYAVKVSSLPGITALLGAGAAPDRVEDGGESALHLAVADPAMVEALLAGGADPDVQNPHTGETPVTTVCLAGEVPALDLLAQAGADLSHRDLLGELAIHTCARTNQGALILRMLELGVDPLAATKRGDTFQEIFFGYNHDILSDRAIEQRRQIVAWLLAHGYPIVPKAERYR